MGADGTSEPVVEQIPLTTPQYKTVWESGQKESAPFVLFFDEEGGPIYVPSEAFALATANVTVTPPTEQERKADRRAVCLAAVVLLAGLFIAPLLWCLGWAFVRHRNKHARRLGKASIALVIVAMIFAAIVVAFHLAGHHHRRGRFHHRHHGDNQFPERPELDENGMALLGPHHDGEDGNDGKDGNDGHDGRHPHGPHRDGEDGHDGNDGRLPCGDGRDGHDGNDSRRPHRDGRRPDGEDGHDNKDGHHHGRRPDGEDGHDNKDGHHHGRRPDGEDGHDGNDARGPGDRSFENDMLRPDGQQVNRHD